MAASWTFVGMGTDDQWSFAGGDISWGGNSLSWDGADQSDTAALTGFAAEIFDGDVSDDTDCAAQFFVTQFAEPGGFEFRMKGGDWVFVPVVGGGAVSVPCRTGSGSGFDIRGLPGGNGVAYLCGMYLSEGHAARMSAG